MAKRKTPKLRKGQCGCTKTGRKYCRLKSGKVRFKKGKCRPR